MKTEWLKVKDAFHKLNFILTAEQKKYGVIVFAMSIISAILELLCVTVLMPLLQAFLAPDTLADQDYVKPFVRIFNLQTVNQIVIFVCIGIILLYLLKNAYNVFNTWVSSKFSCKIMRELSTRILSAYMKQGYSFFVNNNSARLLRGLGSDVNSVYSIVSQLFSLMNRVFTLLCITAYIVYLTPSMALYLLFLIAFCFALTQKLFREPMKKYGRISREYAFKCNQATLEAIQGSKEVLVTNRQEYFINRYRKCMRGANQASIRMSIGATAPSYIIEAICISGLMLAVAIQMIGAGDSFVLLGKLAMLAIASFRILPSLGAILSIINSFMYLAPALTEAYDTLYLVKDLEENTESEVKRDTGSRVEFSRELVLSHVSFAYEGRREQVINDLSLRIEKGESIAFIGTSGAGKTTLSDIILALLKPQSGEILMDGVNIEKLGGQWNRIIGYVPQSIYMTDSSIRRNIAFGIAEEDIDDKKVWKALEMAQLKTFVEGLPMGLDTQVGEWGIQFSGGQRQRVAIARALYGEPDIMILDEATAALDTETETAVMESIEALQGFKTLIIVAHRLTTIRKCDKIYEIKEGKAILRNKNEVLSGIIPSEG